MKQLVVYMLTCLLFCLNSCKKEDSKTKDDIIAVVDGEKIHAHELEAILKQELYDELNRIYELKKNALSQLIDIKLVQGEAEKHQMSYQQYIDHYTTIQIDKLGIDSLLKRYGISNVLQLHGTEMYMAPVNTASTNIPTYYQLKGFMINELLDSLRLGKSIEMYIYPPKSPLIDLKNLYVHYRGNLQSPVTFVLISDFDCESCIKSHHLYSSIYNEYRDRVRFGYLHYSDIPTIAQIASEAADKQGQFWAFHDSLYSNRGYIDSIVVNRIAQNVKLNLYQFRRDFDDLKVRSQIENTINQLLHMGVYATPTILINGRLIVNSDSKDEICFLLNKELSSIKE